MQIIRPTSAPSFSFFSCVLLLPFAKIKKEPPSAHHEVKSESSRYAMLSSVDADGAAAEVTKIRKRRALSSSEPRRTRRRLRLKRSVRHLIGRSGSPCKTTSRRRRMSESSWTQHHNHRRRDAGVDTRPTSAASARKLVSALWQLDSGVGACEAELEVGWDAAAARRGSGHHLRRSSSMKVSKPSRRNGRGFVQGDGERRWRNDRARGQWFSDAMSNGGTVEARACPPPGLASPCSPGDRTARQQELYTSMTASKELVGVLANVLSRGAPNPTATSLLAALRSELDVARARARQLAREQKRNEATELQVRERLAEEMRAWKSRRREKAAAAARVVASELDAERRTRRRAERVCKKLGVALAEAETSLREARWELDREREARERLEKVCDELASCVGVGGAAEDDVEERRREAAESAQWREELEREREMLQLADELREERIRMKLAEARLQFEEKNAVVDRLRQELEAFLGRDKNKDDGGGSPPARDEHRDAADNDHRLQLILASEPVGNGIDRVAVHRNREDRSGEVDDGSEGSDIELNVDGNSRDYSWSYSVASRETTTGKNAASRSSRHGSFSDRGTDGGGFDRKSSRRLVEAPEQHRNEEGCSDDDDRNTAKDMDEDAERYEAIKNLREQMLAGHGVFLSQHGGADADDRDHHRRHAPGFVCDQVEEGGCGDVGIVFFRNCA